MFIVKHTSAKEIPEKRENALANSSYLKVKDKKDKKYSFEQSQRGLIVKR